MSTFEHEPSAEPVKSDREQRIDAAVQEHIQQRETMNRDLDAVLADVLNPKPVETQTSGVRSMLQTLGTGISSALSQVGIRREPAMKTYLRRALAGLSLDPDKSISYTDFHYKVLGDVKGMEGNDFFAALERHGLATNLNPNSGSAAAGIRAPRYQLMLTPKGAEVLKLLA